MRLQLYLNSPTQASVCFRLLIVFCSVRNIVVTTLRTSIFMDVVGLLGLRLGC